MLAAATLWACMYLSGAHVKPGLHARRVCRRGRTWPGQPGARRSRRIRRPDPDRAQAGRLRPAGDPLRPAAVSHRLLPAAAARRTLCRLGDVHAELRAASRACARGSAAIRCSVCSVCPRCCSPIWARACSPILTFGAGALLLASAAMPSVIEHIEQVRAHLPILFVEGSSWFCVLTGVLLLGLARGIDGRLRVAYRVTHVAAADQRGPGGDEGPAFRRGAVPARGRRAAAHAQARVHAARDDADLGDARWAGTRVC